MSLKELQPREKQLLIAGGAALVVFIIIMYSMFAGGDAQNGDAALRRMEHTREVFLADLEHYRKIRGTVARIDKKLDKTPQDYDLYGTLSGFVDALGMRNKITNMSPHQAGGTDYYTESYVDMDLRKIALEDLVDFLKKIESAPAFLRVSQLSVKRRFSKNRALDVTIRVTAYAHKREATP